ncbi:PepSY-associated TM helix domain-containing protein [soil metagenome]
MIKQLKARNLHRDLGYFYVGLIVAFSLSGIFQNHRNQWSPPNYTYNEEKVSVKLPANEADIDEALVKDLSKQWNLEEQYKGHRVRNGELRITYMDYLVEVDVQTGQGTKESYFAVPVLAQSTKLHKETSFSWIWYSDIFAVALATIAITGMFIQKGKTSFRQRGWKFALVGILFPLAFLFLIS